MTTVLTARIAGVITVFMDNGTCSECDGAKTFEQGDERHACRGCGGTGLTQEGADRKRRLERAATRLRSLQLLLDKAEESFSFHASTDAPEWALDKLAMHLTDLSKAAKEAAESIEEDSGAPEEVARRLSEERAKRLTSDRDSRKAYHALKKAVG